MNKGVLEKMLRDTREFKEEHIRESAQFIEGFVKRIMSIELPDMSYLWKSKKGD